MTNSKDYNHMTDINHINYIYHNLNNDDNNVDNNDDNNVDDNTYSFIDKIFNIYEKIQIKKNIKKCDTCIICFELNSINNKCSILSCKHIYHSECINEWFDNSETCPICRKKIKHV
jgi:hypothetical protein